MLLCKLEAEICKIPYLAAILDAVLNFGLDMQKEIDYMFVHNLLIFSFRMIDGI